MSVRLMAAKCHVTRGSKKRCICTQCKKKGKTVTIIDLLSMSTDITEFNIPAEL